MIERDQTKQEAEWIKDFTLSDKDFRRLILEKMERNGLKARIAEQRKVKEVD
jgi:hypothetical protein